MAQQGEKSGIDEIEELFNQAYIKFLFYLDDFYQKVGNKALSEVRRQIDRGVNDQHGWLKRGQGFVEGDKRGYVAVRPMKEKGAGRDSVRPVTIFLDRGFRPGGGNKRVDGRNFYAAAVPAVRSLIEKYGKDLEEKLKDDLSGSV